MDIIQQCTSTKKDGRNFDLISHKIRKYAFGDDGLVIVLTKHTRVEVVIGTYTADDEIHFTRAAILR
jgi:hypothetical protein